MASFYLQPLSDINSLYELHATTDISVSFGSSVTSYPIEDGADVTDNVVLEPIVVSFQGILTDVSQASSLLSVDQIINRLTSQKDEAAIKSKVEYIENLRTLQRDKELFLVYFSGDNDGELSDLETAILTGMDINKTAEIGSSWEVSVEMQEARLASRAVTGAQPLVDYVIPNENADANGAGVDGDQSDQIEKNIGTFTDRQGIFQGAPF